MSQSPRGNPCCESVLMGAAQVRQFVATPMRWPNPLITVSFMPDGTQTPYGMSRLFNMMRNLSGWKDQIRYAFGSWRKVCGIGIVWVSDDGSPAGGDGMIQGDPRFGDVRIGAVPITGALAATIYPPSAFSHGTNHGDMYLSTRYRPKIGSAGPGYDVRSLVTHEAGHAIGLAHSFKGTVMYGSHSGIKRVLTADDIAGARKMYGLPM